MPDRPDDLNTRRSDPLGDMLAGGDLLAALTNTSPWGLVTCDDLPEDYNLLCETVPLLVLLDIVRRWGGTRVYVYRHDTRRDYPPGHPLLDVLERHGEAVVEAIERLTPGYLSIPAPTTVWRRAATRLLRAGRIEPHEAVTTFGVALPYAREHWRERPRRRG
ncbi:MAG: hypothetical protein KatS3mg042_1291 [Rhodothermaceae bacterium]|nr:MAG: hypothetical protein KatS3mg042_1291 [Rhodothermaceae bacterium]